ncbi:MAG TPA: 16S rRNA (adenine(1518)-N(6)/adenine(1519)-N(6))-dimethyltransferase RsmA [Terriglobales bacterium]|nr:16S rRNA (adenine(1518)-N(6)/adenine(1519)-N(6))-dimethyltransferase RsmA [Terriglobales bacterium]
MGQTFLTDGSAARRIVEALGDVSRSTVLEIGPGRGALTGLLLERAGRLIAVELDRVLAAQLRLKYATRHNLEIVEGDALAIDFGTLVMRSPGPLRHIAPGSLEKAYVVGNLPYYITSDLLLRLFAFHDLFARMVLMVQREVGERLAAAPGGRDYGLLSATAQLYARVEKLFTLPPGAFSPPPKVHSSVLRLTIEPKMEKLGVPEQEFQDFLKLSFAQKRKTLVNNLKPKFPEAEVRGALSAARLRPDVRAEAASLEKMAAVFRHLETAASLSRA